MTSISSIVYETDLTEIIRQNVECRSDAEIGLNFSGDRRDDFAWTSLNTGFTPKKWVEGNIEYCTDSRGNIGHRIIGLSAGGEVCRPVLESWDRLDKLELPALDNPAYYQPVRDLAASGTDKFKLAPMPGWSFSTCRYMRKMEIYFMDLLEFRAPIDILHDRVTTLLEKVIDRYGEAGMDGIMFWEDLGIQDRMFDEPGDVARHLPAVVRTADQSRPPARVEGHPTFLRRQLGVD